ncbi:MAG: CtsR family transcriptional regulator [Ruminococcus sp.]|nr:CtsR family transcriptional regulator [Candidatus Copronaster equi]
MNMSNLIANMIMEMLQDDGQTEIQRNELAQTLGCVPSQINYVISSRFTPEQGYIVESRRGGGGYIKITRTKYDDKSAVLMHVVNSIGDSLDESTCRAHVYNLNYQHILSAEVSKLILIATSEQTLHDAPPVLRDKIRASIFKKMLMTTTR